MDISKKGNRVRHGQNFLSYLMQIRSLAEAMHSIQSPKPSNFRFRQEEDFQAVHHNANKKEFFRTTNGIMNYN